MPIIKRYPNRKLYDTEAKQYITLDEIASLIRAGEEVHVVDHASGEDLTALTLTQIIFEQEKKQGGFLPRSLLSGLIQAGGDRINALQRTLASSLGFSRQVNEEIERRIENLITEGEITPEQGQDLRDKLVEKEKVEHKFNHEEEHLPDESKPISQQDIEQYLIQRQVPSRSDLQRLLKELDDLSARLDEMGR